MGMTPGHSRISTGDPEKADAGNPQQIEIISVYNKGTISAQKVTGPWNSIESFTYKSIIFNLKSKRSKRSIN